MKYTSTRGADIVTTFEEVICSGYASDGGLFVPTVIPTVSHEELTHWATLGYVDLAYEILRRFIAVDEIPNENLKDICHASYSGFNDPIKAVPVVKMGPIFVAELFHGPTFCFKDLGMRPTIALLSYFATKRNRRISLVVSTTGDTGPAAVQAVADIANPLLSILVHYPEGQISTFQRKQMTCIDSKVVQVATFQGGGDDMDLPIKNLLAQQDTSSGQYLTGVNSYNFARPMAQIVHHVWTYLRVIENVDGKQIGDEIDIILPTGAMGNIAGGEIARKMGLPIRKYCLAVNANDITYRVMQTGQFHKSEAMIKTLSDAINIQLPYNFERLLFYLTEGDQDLVRKWMTSVDQTTKVDLDSSWVEKMQEKYSSARVTDEEMCNIMKLVVDKFDYFADPHTCIAFAGGEKLGYKLDCKSFDLPTALLATASPCKFEESVTVALGEDGWKAYAEKSFPAKAEEIMGRNEVPPATYNSVDGKPLAEIQVSWEAQARGLLAKLATAS